MCMLNLTVSDAIMQQMRPLFSTEEAVIQWFQQQLTLQAETFLANKDRIAQESYVRDSLARAMKEIKDAEVKNEKLETAEKLLEEMAQW